MDILLYRCGYCWFLIYSQCEDLLQPKCLMEIYVEGQHDLVEDSNKVLTVVQKDEQRVIVGLSTEDAMEEKLIKFVQDRPPLYNAKLSLHERTQSKKTALWMEIYNLFGGKISLEDLQKKWKYLRDRFNRAKKRMKEYKPSGSQAVGQIDPGFSFYNLMLFLDDGLSNQLTTSSVQIPRANSSTSSLPPSRPSTSKNTPATLEELSDERPTSSAGQSDIMSPIYSDDINKHATPARAKIIEKRKKDEESSIEKEIQSILLGAKKEPDGVDFFVNILGESLRKLPYVARTKLELEIMNLVYETERHLNI